MNAGETVSRPCPGERPVSSERCESDAWRKVRRAHQGWAGEKSDFFSILLARIIHEGSSRNRGDAMRDGRVER